MTRFRPHEPMSARLSLYLAAICKRAKIAFDPNMTQGQARAFVLSHQDVFLTSAMEQASG